MNLFYKAQNGWCADVIPFYKDGTYYLYYLHDYRDPENFGEGTPWYLLTTQDFVTFQEYGEVLPRGSKEERDLYVFTGCVFEDAKGVTPYPYHIYYTGHNPHYPTQGKPLEMVMHAVSQDLIHWEKQQDIFYQAPAGYEQNDWRDPFVWFSEEKQAYCMLTAARSPEGPSRYRGCTALSVSDDLIHWSVTEPMLAEGSFYTHECPDYFEWNGWYYLLFSEFSSMCRTHYRISRSPFGPWEKPVDDVFDARGLYAAKTAGNKERRYIFGWNATREGESDSGRWMWGSNIVIHELRQRADGTLYASLPKPVSEAYPAKTLVSLCSSFGDIEHRGGETLLKAERNTVIADGGVVTENMVLEAVFEPDEKVCALGVSLCVSEEKDKQYNVFYDFDAGRLALEKWPAERPDWPFMLESERLYRIGRGQKITFRLFRQGTVLEAYVTAAEDGAALSTRLYDLKDGSFGVFAKGGNASVKLTQSSIG